MTKKLIFGLLFVSTQAFAVNYELAEMQNAMCEGMGEASVQGYKARKSGFERSVVNDPAVAAKYGKEVQQAMLDGYDAKVQSEKRAFTVGFAKCMDRYPLR